MEYINSTDFKLQHTCVTLGKFDGIHRGHRLLLSQLEEKKREYGGKSVVFTFDFHPGMLFSNNNIPLIYTEQEKREMLREAGVDVLIAYPFTKETSGMEAEDFIRSILVEKLGVKALAVGADNRFGHNRRGNAEMLKSFGKEYGFLVTACDKVREGGEIISSSRIRRELLDGHIETANLLLGMPYHVTGMVTHGKQLGRKLGFPTINLIPEEGKLLPPRGVYATRTLLPEGYYEGITNVGIRPTVGEQNRAWVETSLFGYNGDCYGSNVKIEFYHYMRPELRFPDVTALQQQLQKDKELGKAFFSGQAR